jgi:hypothetical protein
VPRAVATKPVGRPPVGERVAVRLPADLLGAIDRHASLAGLSRAAAIRALLRQVVRADQDDPGVDRAQIRRMLELTPAERVRRASRVERELRALRGAVHR